MTAIKVHRRLSFRPMEILKRHVRRWWMFNAVGVLGVVVQLVSLELLTELAGIAYLPATATAVEAAILHNFIWHEHWTWSDRGRRTLGGAFLRLVKFNLTNGMISMCGNLLLMWLLVGEFGLHYLEANLIAIASCSLLNYIVSDRFVFTRSHAIRPESLHAL